MHCPVCKAENVEGPRCRRCKADLGLLFAVEERREQALAAARRELGRGRWGAAAAEAARANGLRRGADAERLLALAHLLNRDYSAALSCYRAAAAGRPSGDGD